MNNFPPNTAVNKFVPKNRFGKDLRSVEKITWANKFSPTTLNITETKNIPEVEVFEVAVRSKEISVRDLKIIQTAIADKPILFVLTFVGEQKLAMFYENELFQTGWNEKPSIEIRGSSTSQIRDNFLRQINPDLQGDRIEQAVERNAEAEKIKKQIEALNKRIAREVQDNKRQELARERYGLEMKLQNNIKK